MKVIRNNNSSHKYKGLSTSQMLIQYISDNNISENALSKILQLDRKTLRSILDGDDFKLSHAIRIATLLNISPEHLVANYIDDKNSKENEILEETRKNSFLLENFDLSELKSLKIISSTKPEDYRIIETEICNYFGYQSLYEYSNTIIAPSLFSKSKMSIKPTKEQKMKDFWLKTNITSFKACNNTNIYDREYLIEFLKKIRPLTLDTENGFTHAIYVLYKIGITVLVQPYLTKTNAFGVSMIVDNKPCIVITDCGKRYHKLWFTLLHELYHILEDYEYLEKATYHISDNDEADLFVSEANADSFALEAFLSKKQYPILEQIISFNHKINRMAELTKVHPSILYGIYLEKADKKTQSKEFPKYSKYLLKSDVAIKKISFDPINQKSIELAVNKMKKNLNILTA